MRTMLNYNRKSNHNDLKQTSVKISLEQEMKLWLKKGNR